MEEIYLYSITWENVIWNLKSSNISQNTTYNVIISWDRNEYHLKFNVTYESKDNTLIFCKFD